jgi:hypothetical protein
VDAARELFAAVNTQPGAAVSQQYVYLVRELAVARPSGTAPRRRDPHDGGRAATCRASTASSCRSIDGCSRTCASARRTAERPERDRTRRPGKADRGRRGRPRQPWFFLAREHPLTRADVSIPWNAKGRGRSRGISPFSFGSADRASMGSPPPEGGVLDGRANDEALTPMREHLERQRQRYIATLVPVGAVLLLAAFVDWTTSLQVAAAVLALLTARPGSATAARALPLRRPGGRPPVRARADGSDAAARADRRARS